MDGLTSAELASIRSDAASIFLTDSCEIWRKGTARAADGGVTDAYTAHVTGIKGSFVPMQRQSSEVVDGDKITSEALYRVSLAVGTDVRATDRVKVLSSGQFLEVGNVDDQQTNGSLLHINCMEVR